MPTFDGSDGVAKIRGEDEECRVRSADGESWTRWTHEVRKMEFERTLEHVHLGRGSTVLELGSGDGFQLALLRERFGGVFSVDPKHAPADDAQRFTYAAAEALPFGDCTFDLIFSNCVLEHLNDRRRGMQEAVRVLKPGGYMAHVVPARFWKVASLCLNPIGYPLRVAEKWHATRKLARENGVPEAFRSGAGPQPGILTVLGRWLRPPIHGTYPSHLSECRSYGRHQWAGLFDHPDLVPVAEVRLPCVTQFGFLRFRLVPLRKRLGELGLNSSWAFIMRRPGSAWRRPDPGM
ncbi:MAG: class I SAM-dependent methyltransferase [Candidatus Acidiferrales bacterium]